jgi:hypothetical protein
MLKYNHWIRRVVVLAVLLTAIQPAFALLTIKNPVVKDVSGNNANNAILQLISGGSTSTPSPATSPYYSGSLYSSQFANTGSNGISVQTIAITESNLNIVLKAWNGKAGPGSYYGFVSGSSGGTKDTFRWDPPTITTNYEAAAPYTPKITEFDETTATDPATGNKTSTLKVVAAAGAVTAGHGQREGSTYAWQMGEKGATLATVTGATESTLSLSSDQVTAGKTYTFKVNCSGPWGTSDWAQQDYTVAGTTSGPTVTHTYSFIAPVSDAFVTPTSMCFSSLTTNVNNTAVNLAKTINNANNTVSGFYVTAIYQANPDPTSGQNYYALFDPTNGSFTGGTLLTDGFYLTPREPIQVYTTKGGTITL